MAHHWTEAGLHLLIDRAATRTVTAMPQAVVVEASQLANLLTALHARKYRVIGPTVRDGAIVYDELTTVSDLPVGWTDEQEAGQYRLRRRDDGAYFGYAVGPHAWKRFLHPSPFTLWRARRTPDGVIVELTDAEPSRFAFLGVRPCDLAAIGILDRVLRDGPYVDPSYRDRRDHVFVVTVQCANFTPSTCFCVSMGTGPRAENGFDLALTELLDPESHRFLVEIGSERGAEILHELPHRPASASDWETATRLVHKTAARMGRQLEVRGLPEALLANLEHPRWDHVAARCLTCGNCTMVCPTCFCFSVEDRSDLTGSVIERVRTADVCFTTAFTYTAGKSLRQSARSRYRQWLTHKLATWVTQFGTFGCVGCGRCITWCPVGIDITEEAAAISGLTRKDERP